MPKCAPHRRNSLDATLMADSRINDRLIKCIHSSTRRVLNSSASYFVVSCFQHKTFYTSKLLNHVALSVELMMQKVSHLIQIIAT